MASQAHIHLSTTLGGSPEYAPDLKWKVVAPGRKEIPNIIGSYTRGLSGNLVLQQFRKDGAVKQFTDFGYILKVDGNDGYDIETRKAQLTAMNGKLVYLVDHFHPADGQDHTAYVKTMYCQIGEFPGDFSAFQRFEVEVMLTDATLVEMTVVDSSDNTIIDSYGRTIII